MSAFRPRSPSIPCRGDMVSFTHAHPVHRYLPQTPPARRRPVKRSAAEHVPESPISYHPSTVPSMPQHVLKPCAPLVIRKVSIKPEKPASSHTTPSPHMLEMLREIDEFNKIHDSTFSEGASQEFVETLKPLYRHRSLPDIPSPPPRSHVFRISFKSVFRRLRSSVKSMLPTNACESSKKLFRWRVKI
ncbi:hypothetical protein K503DRAFT_186476 [Rhizopogon vinicolor AM-OR11-026]|uniref:Uncharacterized protein n=1 Tax=Rhizopogon vinicolor AM-OR11-026 TaxID=1314800 RepID=A0A1B7MZP4_9AGAM|nr:hypothetical protein K503DRAFT_186476 [Rhizopogon vinicolor AM-OR11-026]